MLIFRGTFICLENCLEFDLSVLDARQGLNIGSVIGPTYTMAWSRKRKAPSFKRPFKRRRFSSSRKSAKFLPFKKRIMKRTWKKTHRNGRLSARKFFKGAVHKMSRKLQRLPMPAMNTWLDTLRYLQQTPEGGVSFSGYGNASTAASSNPYSFTASPMDPFLLMFGIFNNLVGQNSSAFARQATTVLLNSFEVKYAFTNSTNTPVNLTCFTVKVKQDVPVVPDYGFAADRATGMGLLATNPTDFLWEYLYSYMCTAQLPQESGVGPDVLTSIVPPGPTTGGGTDPAVWFTHPAWKLTDLPWFNQYFQIKGVKHRVLQPGRGFHKIIHSKRPKTIRISDYLDAVAFNTIGPSSGDSYALKLLAKKNTYLYIWRLEGVPGAYNSTNPGAITKARVQCIQTRRFQASLITTNQPAINAFNDLPSNTTGYNIMQPGYNFSAPQSFA